MFIRLEVTFLILTSDNVITSNSCLTLNKRDFSSSICLPKEATLRCMIENAFFVNLFSTNSDGLKYDDLIESLRKLLPSFSFF